jgi:hypothetical protein
MSAFAGVLTGAAGAYLTALLAFVYPVLPIVVAPLIGRLVADAVLSFGAETKSVKPEVIGVGSVLLGSFIAFGLPFGSLRIAHGPMPGLTSAMIGVSIGISAAFCYFRLKRPTTK